MIHTYVCTYVSCIHTYLPGRKAQVDFACLHIPRRKTPRDHDIESSRRQ